MCSRSDDTGSQIIVEHQQSRAPPAEGSQAPPTITRAPETNQDGPIKEPTTGHAAFAPQPPREEHASVAECNRAHFGLGRLLEGGKHQLLALVGTADTLTTLLHLSTERVI